jgi:2-methylcitrate dehydratase
VFLSPTLGAAGGTVASVLAAAEARNATGEAVVAGLAVGHEVHGELAYNAPIDGLHPATHGAIGAAVRAARAMRLDAAAIESAAGIAGRNATLAVEAGDHGALAVGDAARAGVDAALLADNGVVGPDALGGEGGWEDLVGAFDLDLDPGCERVRDAAIRPFDAPTFAQSALEAAVDLATDAALDPAVVDAVTVGTFADAVPTVGTDAVAKALVDRAVTTWPTGRADLDPVAEAVTVREDEDLTDRTDAGTLPATVTVSCRDGRSTRSNVTGSPAIRPGPRPGAGSRRSSTGRPTRGTTPPAEPRSSRRSVDWRPRRSRSSLACSTECREPLPAPV